MALFRRGLKREARRFQVPMPENIRISGNIAQFELDFVE
jgi:hypothetical protein